MTPDLWVPGLVILVAGAAVGWWFMHRRAASGAESTRSKAKAPEAGDSLEAADLRGLRDELYTRLRDPELAAEERAELEIRAARVLRELDELEGAAARPAKRKAGAEPPAPVAAPHSRSRTLVTGFVFGGATAALIALLIFWAEKDAKPKEEMTGGGPAPTADRPHPEAAMPPEIAAEVGKLEAHLEGSPDDLAARKRLALLYLNGDQYVPAFEQAEMVLAVLPDDIDSHYVQGVVRMTMGQDDQALARLDRVLELFPDHVRAMTVKGLIFARAGNREAAAETWNLALEIGGPQPEIENLLAMLESQGEGDLPPGHPPAESPAGSGGALRRDAYTVRLEADTIEGFPQTGVLFVALRTGASGPPLAVRRIDQPAFPMMITVGPEDMMMAAGDAELPAEGLVTVRLDQDGSVATVGENDLEGSAAMSRGDLATIFLD